MEAQQTVLEITPYLTHGGPSDKQDRAHGSNSFELLYGGAKMGGKSTFLCWEAFTLCHEYRGNRLFMGRKRAVDFNNTTLVTFEREIPQEFYEINKVEKRIYIKHTGSWIDYGGMDDQNTIKKFNSGEYGAVLIDQAEEITRDDYALLKAAVRWRLPDGSKPKYRIILTANPAPCWLRDYFIINPQGSVEFIQALPTDNPSCDEAYLKNLEESFSHRQDLLEAYLHGSWDQLEGGKAVIQHSWTTSALRYEPKLLEGKKYGSCDPAGFGDDEAVCDIWEDRKMKDQVIFSKLDVVTLGGHLLLLAKKNQLEFWGIEADGAGVDLVTVFNKLAEGTGIRAIPIYMSSKPDNEKKELQYANLRAQIWWEAGRLFHDGQVGILNDPTLIGQLCGVEYDFKLATSQIIIEPKEKAKLRLGRSPDRADACVLGIYAYRFARRNIMGSTSGYALPEVLKQKSFERELEGVSTAGY